MAEAREAVKGKAEIGSHDNGPSFASLRSALVSSAVDGGDQLDRDVGLHPSGPFGELVGALLDIAPVDVVEGAVEPVAEVLVHGAEVTGDRALPSPGGGGEIVLEGFAQGGDGAGAGALGERVVA